MAFLVHRSRTRHIDCVKNVLFQLGEWSRVKHALVHVFTGVKKIQRAFREFVLCKRERCNMITQEWVRVEEYNLPLFYKHYTELIVQEEEKRVADMNFSYVKNTNKNRSSTGGMGILGLLQKESGESALAVDWRKFCILPSRRAAMIEHFYGVQLRRRSRGKKNVVELMKNAMKLQKENACFLQFFGAETKRGDPQSTEMDRMAKRLSVMSAPSEQLDTRAYWFPSEQMILNMIALAVQELTVMNILPFRDHAARKANLKGNVFYRGNEQALHKLSQQMFSKRGDIKVAMIDMEEPDESPKASRDMMKDIDDVFDSFTPRYCESQPDD
jgi:hypothetical protein